MVTSMFHCIETLENILVFFGRGVYYVLTVLPFGWKSSPLIYHSITEAANMYIRSLGISMLGWIDDMLGMTEQLYRDSLMMPNSSLQ